MMQRITNMSTNESQTVTVDDFNFEYHSLISLKLDSEEKMLQCAKSHNGGINFTFNLIDFGPICANLCCIGRNLFLIGTNLSFKFLKLEFIHK